MAAYKARGVLAVVAGIISFFSIVQRADSGGQPIFDPSHPDANPGPRSNLDLLKRPEPNNWQIAASWPSETQSAITSAAGGGGGLAAGEKFGQVTGVDVDRQGRVWVLHRTPGRQWDGAAFDFAHKIQYKDPIQGATIVRYASEGATTIDLQAGAGMFQMPHMIKVDFQGNIWVVDCGLHQVLKFAPGDLQRPVLSLGVALEPGHDSSHFCKPTDVAIVAADGTFFVSDGYCNARVIHYSADGRQQLNVWGTRGSGPGQFSLPHGLAWDEQHEILYVADRMNKRVQAFTKQGVFVRQYGGAAERWGAVFGVALRQDAAGLRPPQLFVCTVDPSMVRVIDTDTGKTIHSWNTPLNPGGGDLMPHDIAVVAETGTVFVGESKLNRLVKYTI